MQSDLLRAPPSTGVALAWLLLAGCGSASKGPGAPRTDDSPSPPVTDTSPDGDADGDGWTTGDGDCDDEDPDANPAAAEVCDGKDDDCDGLVDDDDPGVAGATWYADADGDGYGAGSGSVGACAQPDGWSPEPTDCNDADGTVHPGAMEVCENGIDDDCDGGAGVCGPTSGSLSGAAAVYLGERPGDAAGVAVAGAGDVNDDGYDDLLVGAGANDDGGTDAGAAYLVLGSAAPQGGGLDGAQAELVGEPGGDGACAGCSLAGVGDVNGDGFGDLLVGAYADDAGGDYAGAAWLVLGASSPAGIDLAAADARYTGEVHTFAGASVSGAGDVNGDGLADLLVGAYYNPYDGSFAGAAYLLLGTASPGDRLLVDADATYTGEAVGDYAGISVAGAGDANGDGLADVVVGAIDNDSGASYAGAAYLVLGDASPADRDLGMADAEYTGAADGDEAGASAAGPGDVDGDGYADILIGAPYADVGHIGAGAAYLVWGGATPVDSSLAAADATFLGEADDDEAGSSVAGAGDVNADGHADLLVGARRSSASGYQAGAAYLVLGRSNPGSLSLGSADARYTGEAAGDAAGVSVAGAGDVDADGYADLLVGARGNGDAGDQAGATYLVLGSGL